MNKFDNLEGLTAWYKSGEDLCRKKIAKTKKIGNIYVGLKLMLFVLFLSSAYYYYQDCLNLYWAIIFIVAYIVVVVVDSQRKDGEVKLQALLKIYSDELRYLDDDFSYFNTGEKYIDVTHHYAFDLDLFGNNSLFQEMNRTISQSGADLLAKHLQYPTLNRKEIEERQEAIDELSKNIQWVNNFRVLGVVRPVEQINKQIIEEWSLSKYDFWNKIRGWVYSLNVMTIVSCILAAAGVLSWGYFTITTSISLIFWIFSIGYVNKTHIKIDAFIKNISNYLYIIDHLSSVQFNSTELRRILDGILNEHNSLKAFKELKKIQNNLDSRSNVLMSILLNALYLRDVHIIINISKWHNKYIDKVAGWINAIDEIDVLISMAIYKYNHPHYSTPRISENVIISAKSIVHPLIKGDNIVSNDIDILANHNIFIVTGANMSGKSTFLRSVALNHVLAITGNVVRCEEYCFKPIALFTSMRTTDNLSNGKSYFQAELLRLKELHNKAGDGTEVLIILDEMLKGTNSEDKLHGSWKFLEKLLAFNISGFVATHDLKLGELHATYPDNFYNICFEIEHVGDSLVYSYQLGDGVSRNMNASFLLNQMKLI